MRIWVAGCSTGQEAYSIAITLIEYLSKNAGSTPIQIFATDVSDQAIEKARDLTMTEPRRIAELRVVRHRVAPGTSLPFTICAGT